MESAFKTIINHLHKINNKALRSKIDSYISGCGELSKPELQEVIKSCFPKYGEPYSFTKEEIRAFALIQKNSSES